METKVKKPADIEPVTATVRKARPVIQYGLDGKFIKTFPSIKNASDVTKTCYSSLSLCLKGKFRAAGGFQWKYAE